jgi:DNA-binding NarL/FixJ family response regulator
MQYHPTITTKLEALTLDKMALALAKVETLSAEESRFLRGLVAGDSQATIASRMKLAQARANAVKQRLMKKLGADIAADAVRIGIYAGF